MPTFSVKIKHAGKVLEDFPLNTDAPPSVFKQIIYERTGVPTDRMKVMIKGGVLKDDSNWDKVSPKEGQIFMVIGAAGELPKPPERPIMFLEDMDDNGIASHEMPCGLKNLGNTCYMNACLQVMRTIPELQQSLRNSAATPAGSALEGNADLVNKLRLMFSGMSSSGFGPVYTPMSFLASLRQAVPQFGELARQGKGGMSGYAQQDAEECWTQIFNALKALPGNFVEHFMLGEMRRELKCDEAAEEEPTLTFEKVLKLECNITASTSYMHTGILEALDQKIEKTSPSLGREAVYTQRSRLSRIPVNLTIHMVRFAWKKDIRQKAKIMRKVKFPLEFDALDLCTDELKQKLLPVNTRLKEIARDRCERAKVRKRTKPAAAAGPSTIADVEMADARGAVAAGGPASPVLLQAPAPAGAEPPTADAVIAAALPSADKGKGVEGGALEPEEEYRKREIAELSALVPDDVRSDEGTSFTGLYELVGIVTHKGAAADSGHYMAYIRQRALRNSDSDAIPDEDDEDWYKFDDDKVSVFPKEKLSTLDGGGEDSSAYVLLYRSVGF
ncbi:hypothetical protein EW145_g4618 [Phellinidium pouzarii]|uniref:Ubiquitin carboxyl-terminal hydrolase n=1 Tax=Phellinidium pouzarii TaxID=167371 RepID=A0A4S4L2T4_9AGAM|nr:hypothetical protein EW145_g4618 [Phellinidium pouzarii]